MEISEKIWLFEQAKKTIDIFRKAGAKATMFMNSSDRVYFTIQKFLQNRKNNKVKALAAGIKENRINMEERINFIKELHEQEYTERTNEVSKELNQETQQNEKPLKDEEYVK